MSTSRKKIIKEKGQQPDALEQSVAQALFDLGVNSNELKSELHSLYITAAKEVEVPGGKKAIILFVPYVLLPNFHRIHTRLVRELEKKFSGKNVVIIANRKILPKESRNNRAKRQKRPRSRTLTSVHDAILEDLVYPTEIIGKRTRIRLDNSKLLKIYLDRKDQTAESKLDTFATVYKRLTGKEAQFLFPVQSE
jgi:small subunit ribosomal protein S7e